RWGFTRNRNRNRRSCSAFRRARGKPQKVGYTVQVDLKRTIFDFTAFNQALNLPFGPPTDGASHVKRGARTRSARGCPTFERDVPRFQFLYPDFHFVGRIRRQQLEAVAPVTFEVILMSRDFSHQRDELLLDTE